MDNICCISKEELSTSPIRDKFMPIRSLNSIEDVATLIDVFEATLLEVDSSHIIDVLENSNKFYLMVTDEEGKSSFDFYDFINSKYKGKATVTCVNAKLLFPMGKSRGLYSEEAYEEDTEECDDATGFMDEDEIDSLLNQDTHHLHYPKLDTDIPIPAAGIVIGRSAAKSEYIISGNTNVSREHCRVYKDGDVYKVHDCNSNNGTFVNGMRVHSDRDVVLTVGATLMLAGEEFILV